MGTVEVIGMASKAVKMDVTAWGRKIKRRNRSPRTKPQALQGIMVGNRGVESAKDTRKEQPTSRDGVNRVTCCHKLRKRTTKSLWIW